MVYKARSGQNYPIYFAHVRNNVCNYFYGISEKKLYILLESFIRVRVHFMCPVISYPLFELFVWINSNDYCVNL